MKTDELKMAKFLLKKVDKGYPSLFRNGELMMIAESKKNVTMRYLDG